MYVAGHYNFVEHILRKIIRFYGQRKYGYHFQRVIVRTACTRYREFAKARSRIRRVFLKVLDDMCYGYAINIIMRFHDATCLYVDTIRIGEKYTFVIENF